MSINQLSPVSRETMRENIGKEVGVSSWRTVSQQIIDLFADATDDHQFIHVDPERAAAETPFGGTIAHGFLTLSLLSTMTYETLPPLEGCDVGINYGFEQIRFVAPVKAGARVRTRFVLASLKERPSGLVEMTYEVTIEIEGSIKPALTARWMTIAAPRRNEG